VRSEFGLFNMCSERAFFLEEEGEFNSSSSFLFYYISFVISAEMKQEVWVIHTVQCGMAGGNGI